MGENRNAPRRVSLPDARWIRREIPIGDVARALGLEGDSRVFDCFRDGHPSDKPRRSLSLHAKSNTVRCVACDKRSLSAIDLVMAVLEVDVGRAIKWLHEHFPGAPRVRVRGNGNGRLKTSKREGNRMSLEDLIVSPGWAALSPSAKLVLTAIVARTPAAGSEQGLTRCTYARIMDWTGIGSRTTISAALEELRQRKAIQTALVSTNLRNQRGFWLKEMVIRVSPRAMRTHQPRVN